MWGKMGLKTKGKYRNYNHVKKQINSKKYSFQAQKQHNIATPIAIAFACSSPNKCGRGFSVTFKVLSSFENGYMEKCGTGFSVTLKVLSSVENGYFEK